MAASMGIDVVRNQALAMGLSMALTAIPGALIAQYASFVSYESVLTLEIGILMMVGAIIGGSSTLAGPIVAGIGIAALEEGLRSFDVTSSSISSITQIIYAAVVILILRLGADGIVPMWNALLDRLFPPTRFWGRRIEPRADGEGARPCLRSRKSRRASAAWTSSPT